MSSIYTHLTTQERAVVMTMRDDQCSVRAIAKRLDRSPSTISREIKRTAGTGIYDANLAHLQSAARRVMPRRTPKMEAGGVLFQVVRHYLNLLWSPQQISNILKAMWPTETDKTVSHETIYNAIYLHPRGELKRELIACLRYHNQVRKPRSRGVDRAIAQHPSKANTRLENTAGCLYRTYDQATAASRFDPLTHVLHLVLETALSASLF